MRVLFAVFPATAHLHPITPLAWALQNAGHEVRVVSHPEMAGPISTVGLTPVPLGQTVDPRATAPDIRPQLDRVTRALALTSDSRPWETFSRQVLPALAKYFPAEPAATGHRDMLDDLVEFTRTWQPDLVLWDPAFLPAPIAARLSGAAHARMMWGPDYFAWSRQKFLKRPQPPGAAPVEDPQLALLTPLLERYGMEFDEELLLGQWTVDPLPAALRLPLDTRSVSVRWVPFNGSSAVPEWLHEPPKLPRVCLSLGITERERSKDGQFSISELLGMVAELDIELVATLNSDQMASLDSVPDNVRTVDYLPLNQLLPSCSAIIHHGGYGTYAAAVAHRVPQLITWKEGGESTGTARHVTERGAGLAMDREQFSAAGLKQQLVRILEEPSFKDGAAGLYADALATPAPQEIVPLLERLTAQHRS
ncbi:activator-dependent family glycosyltransferase [Streptomyces sp. ISL-96]|uniref:activator-dependent family glycosyltransferase n=1 Tax=Streptomyces sp. ISL-96 TaxID=2819191 RepID=UPI001BED26FA|nr:activator-dependent family glycosyltransferase [Streptomyces sp. ISL-96]MBT2488553.1 activator-dependent family glycosyltransferase [Streptomyces sp. ISL-96]